jgi:hypothetical protein
MNNEKMKKPPKPGEAGEYIPHVNKKVAIVSIALFLTLLFIPTIIWGALMIKANNDAEFMAIINPPTSEQEAAKVYAKFPATFNPETYTAEVEAWYNDHLPFRSIIFNAHERANANLEAPYETSIRPVLLEVFAPKGPTLPNIDLENPDETFADDLWEDDETEDTEAETIPEFEDTETPEDSAIVCEHSFDTEGVIETPATCTDWGIIKYPCLNGCGAARREYTKKASHNYIEDPENIPLCGTKYNQITVCSGCGAEKIKDNVIKSHVEGEVLKTVEASYTSYGYTLIRCEHCGGEYRTKVKNRLSDHSNFLPYYRSDTVYEGRHKWLFYRGNNSEAYYLGTNLLNDTQLEEYRAVFQQLNDLCKEKGIQLQISIWPNKEQVYSEYTGIYTDVKEKRVDKLVKYITENSDVNIIYPLQELLNMKPYYEMYLQYDTHWNCAGGFVGYQAMLESLGLETTNIRNCPVFEYTGQKTENKDPYYTQIRGDMLGMGGWPAPKEDYPDHVNYYVKYHPDVTVDTYSGKDGAGDTRHTTAANATFDYNFVMLGDSYRVMQLSYLERDFTDCFLTHRSHVNDEDVKEAIKNADILVIAGVERLEPEILSTAKQIINILSE